MAIIGEQVTVKGIRTHCRTKEAREVECVFEVGWYDKERGVLALRVTEGGVTGYESFLVDDHFYEHGYKRMVEDGWCACAGTDRVWDELRFSAQEMQRAFKMLDISR